MTTVNWFGWQGIESYIHTALPVKWEISFCSEGRTWIRSPKLRLNSYRV